MCCNTMLFIVCYGRTGQENFFAYMWQCYIHSKFTCRLCCFVLYCFIPNCFNSYGSSGREVEYQISYHKDVSSILTHGNSLLISTGKTFGKPPENLRKPPENLRIIPKIAKNYGYSTVFLQPTNRKHIPLYGQFGLAASDHMYGIQRLEF